MSSKIFQELIQAIETELQNQISRLDKPNTRSFHEMLTYHMGWTGEGAGPKATGKRIRPLLVLLSAASANSSDEAGAEQIWRQSLPAAAAVELLHNFSLVHDDIQDVSEKRRGRLTVWKKWGSPMAINAGDALYVLSNQAMSDLSGSYPPEIVVQASSILHNTCLELTEGQFLDMQSETASDPRIEDYWPTIAGKTASLLAACCHIGSLLGGANEAAQDAYKSFGHYLGLAFQLQDDLLGIWGDEAITGKSNTSDLVTRKKTLPVLVGLSKKGPFAERWSKGTIETDEVPELARMLANESAYEYTHDAARQMTDMAMTSLREANPAGDYGLALNVLATNLLRREQ